jgi:hypothetical protein
MVIISFFGQKTSKKGQDSCLFVANVYEAFILDVIIGAGTIVILDIESLSIRSRRGLRR